MDIELARHLLRVNFRCSREMQDTLHLLRDHLPSETYHTIGRGIAAAVAATGQALAEPALRAYPVLNAEVEQQISRFGGYL